MEVVFSNYFLSYDRWKEVIRFSFEKGHVLKKGVVGDEHGIDFYNQPDKGIHLRANTVTRNNPLVYHRYSYSPIRWIRWI